MARYEYLCTECETSFDLERPMTAAEGEVRCPAGHAQVRRRFSVTALVGSGGPAPAPAAGASASGGCCGGACGCR